MQLSSVARVSNRSVPLLLENRDPDTSSRSCVACQVVSPLKLSNASLASLVDLLLLSEPQGASWAEFPASTKGSIGGAALGSNTAGSLASALGKEILGCSCSSGARGVGLNLKLMAREAKHQLNRQTDAWPAARPMKEGKAPRDGKII